MDSRPSLDIPDRLLDLPETAGLLGVTVGTLNQWRSTKRYNLPFVRVGRKIRYRLTDVLNWIDERTETVCQ